MCECVCVCKRGRGHPCVRASARCVRCECVDARVRGHVAERWRHRARHTHTHREREREREKEADRDAEQANERERARARARACMCACSACVSAHAWLLVTMSCWSTGQGWHAADGPDQCTDCTCATPVDCSGESAPLVGTDDCTCGSTETCIGTSCVLVRLCIVPCVYDACPTAKGALEGFSTAGPVAHRFVSFARSFAAPLPALPCPALPCSQRFVWTGELE